MRIRSNVWIPTGYNFNAAIFRIAYIFDIWHKITKKIHSNKEKAYKIGKMMKDTFDTKNGVNTNINAQKPDGIIAAFLDFLDEVLFFIESGLDFYDPPKEKIESKKQLLKVSVSNISSRLFVVISRHIPFNCLRGGCGANS